MTKKFLKSFLLFSFILVVATAQGTLIPMKAIIYGRNDLTDFRTSTKKTLTLQNFCIRYLNVAFVDALELPFIFQQKIYKNLPV